MSSKSSRSSAVQSLSNLVWNSLTGDHRRLSQGDASALRYHPEVAPFGALAQQTPACVNHLAQLMSPGEEICLIDQEASLPDRFDLVSRSAVVQMMYGADADPPGSTDGIRVLTHADLPGMEALIAAVFPGYFRRRTPEMGRFYGIFLEGRLAAMAGERLSVPAYREISSICTHAAHQGQGLAGRLTRFLVGAVRRSGATPFLHVGSQNTTARRLYGRLGFEEIRTAEVNFYRRR